MDNLLSKILPLRNALRIAGWHITAFPFSYKESSYTVIFEINDNIQGANKYYPVLLTFIDDRENTRTLTTLVNSKGFSISLSEIRSYFHVEYQKSVNDFLSYFYNRFNKNIPHDIPNLHSNKHLLDLVIDALNRRDHHDGKFCYDVRRNGIKNNVQMKRTVFNDNKTRLLRLSLYNSIHAENDFTFSFYYSTNSKDDLSDQAILEKFRNRENH